ncbi:hypothetical protein [Romboutsia timonensis]|uniref:hypothetical protein n=1 Tax=Romboutsia timonensis TaxID=1776391 RepID=UPI001B4FEF09|nr:hypothetical protein [Romboutsia timonensis]MBP3929160.1 hypothetical protein [Peptostreptococcaceae bacterium]
MNRYIGKYRVCCEWDRRNLEPIKEDTYVQCSGNGQIYRVSDNLLAYYKPKRGNSEQFSKKLIECGVRSVDNRSSDGDMLIYFAEDSLDIVANMVNASITGADIKPWSVKNLRKLEWFKKKKQFYIDLGYYKELSEEEKEILRQRLARNIK